MGGLKIDRPQVEPTARSVNSGSDKFRHDQKDDAGKIHRQRAPADPAIVNQAGDHKGQETDSDPVRLPSPEISRVIAVHVSRAVDCHNSKNGKGEHVDQQKPVLAEQFSKEGRHALISLELPRSPSRKLRTIIRKLRSSQNSAVWLEKDLSN